MIPFSIITILEFVPAPGQFVNVLPAYEEGDTPAIMAEKCTQTLQENGGMISLGSWGGYVTFLLEHPVVNVLGAQDLYLKGNAYAGNSEPGIVMVSVDANHNGLPDDAWYEIAGSADTDSIGKVTYGYSTYVHHDADQEVSWYDCNGLTGSVARNSFHTQDYFPLWLGDSLTFHGTLLPPNGRDLSGNGSYWTLDNFRYGYVDNAANSDTAACSINLEDAVDPISREPVQLSHADFFRVYSGERQQCGWLGETSTEFCGAIDLHPQASIDFEAGIEQKTMGNKQEWQEYFLLGPFKVWKGRLVLINN